MFKITPAGALSSLVSFNATTGEYSRAGLALGNDGNFYGTTDQTVFKVTSAGTLTVLATFVGTNGSVPNGGVIQGSDGNFYGTTEDGGAYYSSTVEGYGTVYKITPAGVLTTLHSFSPPLGAGGNADGGFPLVGLLQGGDGNLYGTAYVGGTGSSGTVFRITPTGAFTTLYNFSALSNHTNTDGAGTNGSLVQGNDGNFYGTTTAGGAYGDGTVFRLTPAGTLTTLVTFAGNPNGYPDDSLIQGSDGNFYGTTSSGGANGTGQIFRLDGPPIGYGTSARTSENTRATFTVAFDDPSGLGIDSIAFPTASAHGTLTVGTIAETGTTGTVTLTYTPAASYFGKDSFTYTVTGATGTSAPQTVVVTVSGASGLLTGSGVLTTTATIVNLSTPGQPTGRTSRADATPPTTTKIRAGKSRMIRL